MGSATVIINVSGVTLACLDWDIDEIHLEPNGSKTIYNDRGDELHIPADATMETVPGDNSDECAKYSFGNVEVYVEFYN